MKRKNLHLISILTIILFLTALKYSYSQWEFAGTVSNIGDFPEISVADQNTAWIVGGHEGTPVVWRTTNGGTNWTSISTTGVLFDLLCVWGVDANTACR